MCDIDNKNDQYYFTYFVVFKSSGQNSNGPVVHHFHVNKLKFNNGGAMHLFDEDMDSTLGMVEYLMHLPRNIYDVYHIDELLMGASYDTPHFITILPDSELNRIQLHFEPTMFLLTDDCDFETKNICNLLKPLLGSFYAHELNENLLKKLWMALWEKCKTTEYPIVPNIEIQHILSGEHLKALPALFLSRQFCETDTFLAQIYSSMDVEKDCIASQCEYIVRLNALIAMHKQGVREWDSLLYETEWEKALSKLELSIVITFPGIAKQQKKLGMSNGVLTEKERRIIRIMGIHRAIARGGVLIELPCLDDRLSQKYNELEQRCKDGTNNRYVWRALTNLGKQIGRYFQHDQIQLLKRARDITVFSDFPLGLAVFEDTEVPLQCYKSIAYCPLTPLTRRYQFELLRKNQYYLGAHCRIAFAECVPNDAENRYVYRMSKLVYQTLLDQQKQYPDLSVVYKEINDVSDMKNFIATNLNADILYISAHGYYDKSQNEAGIIIGDEFWMADESFPVSPIVILSACHSSPRGLGAITIADMFLRNGALAVLGTFIPVNAHRNLILMTRLFTYIAEAQKKYDQYQTLADAWSGIVASNAIHELMLASQRFRKWMYEKNNRGNVRAIEFQLKRSAGRIRRTHVYSDTIKIIKEMLEEEGIEGRFGDILDQNNYFPESFFYQLLGCPENIFLYNEIFDEYLHKNGLSGEDTE